MSCEETAPAEVEVFKVLENMKLVKINYSHILCLLIVSLDVLGGNYGQ